MNEGKKVDLVLLAGTAIDGEHIEAGTVLEGVEPDLAITLAGAGKARLLKADELKAAKAEAEARAKAKAAAEKAAGK